MPPQPVSYTSVSHAPASVVSEGDIEHLFVTRLEQLKYTYRPDITNRATLEKNFREKFESLNRVRLTDSEFARLLDEIVSPDVFAASKTLRSINAFARDDGTPLNYSLVNLKDWCKNHFEVINQLRINTDHSHHRYDVLILINGVPCVQVELKTLGVNPRRAMEQIVEYKNDPGNGYTKPSSASSSSSSSAIATAPTTSPTTTPATSLSTPTSASCPSTSSPTKPTRRSTHLDSFAETFLKNATLAAPSAATWCSSGEQKAHDDAALSGLRRPAHGQVHPQQTATASSGTPPAAAKHSLPSRPPPSSRTTPHPQVPLRRRPQGPRPPDSRGVQPFQEGCVEENTNTAALVRRLLSEDYADKVIVTTIQKLGLALDESSKRNQQRKKNDQPTYKEMLAALSEKRIVFIFDECHRSQFGENHRAIKEFFPRPALRLHRHAHF
jgi:type I restriction enzyme, R subunit